MLKTTEERIQAVIGEAAVATLPQVVRILGMGGTAAVQSMRNQIARGTFRLRPFKLGAKIWVVSATELAMMIDQEGPFAPGAAADAPLPPLPVEVRKARTSAEVRARTGRPINAQRAERLKNIGLAFAARLDDALAVWMNAEQQREGAELRAIAVQSAAQAGMTTLPKKEQGPRSP